MLSTVSVRLEETPAGEWVVWARADYAHFGDGDEGYIASAAFSHRDDAIEYIYSWLFES